MLVARDRTGLRTAGGGISDGGIGEEASWMGFDPANSAGYGVILSRRINSSGSFARDNHWVLIRVESADRGSAVSKTKVALVGQI